MTASEKKYKAETGDNPTYRKGSSDYHTLKYVRWLESALTAYEAENGKYTRVITERLLSLAVPAYIFIDGKKTEMNWAVDLLNYLIGKDDHETN